MQKFDAYGLVANQVVSQFERLQAIRRLLVEVRKQPIHIFRVIIAPGPLNPNFQIVFFWCMPVTGSISPTNKFSNLEIATIVVFACELARILQLLQLNRSF